MACAEHVLPLSGEKMDQRLTDTLEVALKWRRGEPTVGDARKAAALAHRVARESSNEAAVYGARSVGHAVATAHIGGPFPGGSLICP